MHDCEYMDRCKERTCPNTKENCEHYQILMAQEATLIEALTTPDQPNLAWESPLQALLKPQ